MDQEKIGAFLKHLRKEKGLTQEQLAEKFYVSSRTVSRWETGSNLPDLSMLIDLADFYEVDIREMIDGERKSETMDQETKDTIKKVGEYVEEKSKKLKNKLINLAGGAAIFLLVCIRLFQEETKGALYGIVPEAICGHIMTVAMGLCIAATALLYMHIFGLFDKIYRWKMQRRKAKGEK